MVNLSLTCVCTSRKVSSNNYSDPVTYRSNECIPIVGHGHITESRGAPRTHGVDETLPLPHTSHLETTLPLQDVGRGRVGVCGGAGRRGDNSVISESLYHGDGLSPVQCRRLWLLVQKLTGRLH